MISRQFWNATSIKNRHQTDRFILAKSEKPSYCGLNGFELFVEKVLFSTSHTFTILHECPENSFHLGVCCYAPMCVVMAAHNLTSPAQRLSVNCTNSKQMIQYKTVIDTFKRGRYLSGQSSAQKLAKPLTKANSME
jgi:hypothetical protein